MLKQSALSTMFQFYPGAMPTAIVGPGGDVLHDVFVIVRSFIFVVFSFRRSGQVFQFFLPSRDVLRRRVPRS